MINSERRDKNSWIKSVLSPFDTKALRGPSSYLQPTSLLEAKAIVDFVPGQTNALTVVTPLAHCGPIAMGGWSWDFITNFKSAVPIITLESATFANSTSSIMSGFGSPSSAVLTARFTSYRITQLGVRIIPSGANLNKSGIITLACQPGKSYTT